MSWFALPVAACLGLLLLYNYARFGNVFDTGFPYLNASETHPEPYQMPQPHRIPYNFYNHFLAGAEIRTTDFPLILGKSSNFGGINHRDGSGGLLHNFPSFSVFISMPMLLLILPGFVYAAFLLLRNRTTPAWDYWLYLVALWCCVFAYFLNESGSFMRYQYDMPFLLGMCVLQVVVFSWRAAGRFREPFLRAGTRSVLAVFLGLSFLVQVAIGADQTAGLILSRTDQFIHWHAAERASDVRLRRRAQEIRQAIFNIKLTTTITYGPEIIPSPNVAGSIWLIRGSNTLYRSNGVSWDLVSSEPLRFAVTFPVKSSGHSEPLLQFGSGRFTDALSVRYSGPSAVVLTYQHGQIAPCSSGAITIQPGTPVAMSMESDPVLQRVRIRINEAVVMECSGIYAEAESNQHLGINAIGLAGLEPRFSGLITAVTKSLYEDAGAQRFRLKVTLPEHPASGSEPLLQLGTVRGDADMLGIRYQRDGQFGILFDHWGSPMCSSVPQVPNLGHEQIIEAVIDPVSGHVLAELNGRTVMGCNSGAFPDALKSRLLGKNTLGFTTVGPAFSGTISELPAQH